MALPEETVREIIPGRFILAVNDDGDWRIYRIRAKIERNLPLISVDLSYKGPGTTDARLHYGREREPDQYVNANYIRGIYDAAEEALALIPALESGREDLEAARDRFRVLLALLGNVPLR